MDRMDEELLLKVEYVLEQYRGKALPRVKRRELLSSLAEIKGSSSPVVNELRQRLSFSFIPGVFKTSEAPGTPAGAAANAPNTPVWSVHPVLFQMPTQIDRAFLLRPVMPGQRLQCLLVRQRSTLTRSSPTFLFHLVRVAPSACGSDVGTGNNPTTAGPLFLLGAKRASSSSSSAPSSAAAAASASGSSNASAASASSQLSSVVSGSTYCVHATEKHTDGGRNGGWQEKNCFGWVRGLGPASNGPNVSTATVNDPGATSWANWAHKWPAEATAAATNRTSSMTAPAALPFEAGARPPEEAVPVGNGNSIAIQISAEGPDRLLKLTAVLPATTQQPPAAVPEHSTSGTVPRGEAPSAVPCFVNDDESLSRLFAEATAASSSSSSLGGSAPSMPPPPIHSHHSSNAMAVASSAPPSSSLSSSSSTLVPAAHASGGGDTIRVRALLSADAAPSDGEETGEGGGVGRPARLALSTPASSTSTVTPLPPLQLSRHHHRQPASSSASASLANSSEAPAQQPQHHHPAPSTFLLLRSKLPRWGAGAVCGLTGESAGGGFSSSTSTQQSFQQQQQQQQQRGGYTLDLDWREPLLEASRKNVALVCAHPSYRSHPLLLGAPDGEKGDTSTAHGDDDDAPGKPKDGADDMAAMSSGAASAGAPTTNSLEDGRGLRTLPPSSSSASSSSSSPQAPSVATTIPFSPPSSVTSDNPREQQQQAHVVRAGERGAPAGLWKGGVVLSEPESDRGTVDAFVADSEEGGADGGSGGSGGGSEAGSALVVGGGGAATVLQVVKLDIKRERAQRDHHRRASLGPLTTVGGSSSSSSSALTAAAGNGGGTGGTSLPSATSAAASGHDHFRVDFTSPLSPFQAFAIALAVFEGQ